MGMNSYEWNKNLKQLKAWHSIGEQVEIRKYIWSNPPDFELHCGKITGCKPENMSYFVEVIGGEQMIVHASRVAGPCV